MGCGSSTEGQQDNFIDNASNHPNHPNQQEFSGVAPKESSQLKATASNSQPPPMATKTTIPSQPPPSQNGRVPSPSNAKPIAPQSIQPSSPITPPTVSGSPPKFSLMSSTENSLNGAMLTKVPLLAKLTDAERSKLGGLMTEQKFGDRENIIVEGEVGHGFYIITKGETVVMKNNEKGGKTELARLKEGDYFGEAALISNARRGATVAAVGQVTCLYLEREAFDALFGHGRLNVQFAKRKAISAESNENESKQSYVTHMPANATKEKSAVITQLILASIKDNVLFMGLDAEHKAQIIAEMYRTDIKAGVNAITQGALGDNLYVVESGEFAVFVNGKKVATRGKQTCFGELALMYNSPRAATVTATVDSVVWVVDRFTFRRIVTNLGEKKFGLYVSFLKKVELLSPLVEYERKKIAEALDEVQVGAGQTIFKQGEAGDALYIIYSGEVKFLKKDANSSSSEAVEVGRSSAGDYFGERALLTNEVRAATAVAITNVQLLKLDRNAFLLLLGPLEDIMKKKVQSYTDRPVGERKNTMADSLMAPPQPVVRPSIGRRDIPFNSLKVIGTLGKGSFGYVQLVIDDQRNTYALKAVSKAQIVQTGQQGHVMSEKKVMTLFDHPFLIKLFATYKDQDRLYFLLEPSLGGELFSVLRERTLFDEQTAKFYAASVIMGFEYMHSLNIVYRDLKPENLLLDSQGFLKVTDFGFAKDISAGRTWTLCGTPDYLAPEIVAGKGHGKGVDWWTLGIFIYEMLASYPPFYDEDPMKTYAKIMHGAINFPAHFSPEAQSLIKKLLQHKASKRLGIIQGGAQAIKDHPWFAGFDWDALFHRRMKPPIVPKLKHEHDLSNFDDYSDQEPPQVESYQDDGSNWDAEF